MAEAIGLDVDLLHHSLDVATLGDSVPVSPVGARQLVVLVQVGAYPGGDSLLSGIQVHEARDLARCELYMQPLLELPDRAHRPVGFEQSLLAEFARASDLRHKASFPCTSCSKQ